MCEATVYVSNDGQERKVMQDVVLMRPDEDAWLLVNLLGEQKLVRGSIEKIDFLRHRVYLHPESSGGKFTASKAVEQREL